MPDDPDFLRRVLGALTRDEQLVCIWKIAGFSDRAIAQHLGRSDVEVNSLFAKTKSKLRKHLRDAPTRGGRKRPGGESG